MSYAIDNLIVNRAEQLMKIAMSIEGGIYCLITELATALPL